MSHQAGQIPHTLIRVVSSLGKKRPLNPIPVEHFLDEQSRDGPWPSLNREGEQSKDGSSQPLDRDDGKKAPSEDVLLPEGLAAYIEELFSMGRRTADMTLMMDWDIIRFMKDQYKESYSTCRVGHVITLTGDTALKAQATTCQEYMQRTWPTTWRRTLDAIQGACDSTDGFFGGELPSAF